MTRMMGQWFRLNKSGFDEHKVRGNLYIIEGRSAALESVALFLWIRHPSDHLLICCHEMEEGMSEFGNNPYIGQNHLNILRRF